MIIGKKRDNLIAIIVSIENDSCPPGSPFDISRTCPGLNCRDCQIEILRKAFEETDQCPAKGDT